MLPSTADVAALTSVRTQPKIGGGADTGDFTTHTVPTAAKVSELIEKSGRFVRLEIGDYADLAASHPDLFAAILDVIATRAASLVERSYRPEQAGGSGSLYEGLRDQAAADLKTVTQSMREVRSSGRVSPGEGCLPLATGLEAEAVRDLW